MKFSKNFDITNIILFLILLILAISVIICIHRGKYDTSVGIAAILASIAVPFCTKNLELEKHRQQFLYEKKYESYKQYLENFDEFYKLFNDYELLMNDQLYALQSADKKELENVREKTEKYFANFIKHRTLLVCPPIELRLHYQEEIAIIVNNFAEIETNPCVNSKEQKARMDKILATVLILVDEIKKELGVC